MLINVYDYFKTGNYFFFTFDDDEASFFACFGLGKDFEF